MQAGIAASLLAAGVIGGLAIAQMAAHWPAASGPSTLVVSSTEPSAGHSDSVLPDHVVTTETPAPQSTEAKDVAPYSDNALDAAMDKNADAIAADLNAIAPGVAPATQPVAPAKVANAAPTPVTPRLPLRQPHRRGVLQRFRIILTSTGLSRRRAIVPRRSPPGSRPILPCRLL